MSKVSVIVPVFKAEKFIERCIKSIKNQSLNDWELILVDDCSPDQSFNIINKYAKEDKRIIVKKLESNHGPMVARRIGDEISNGEYLTYCDADDILPEDALLSFYEAALKNESDIVIGSLKYIKCDGSQSVSVPIINGDNNAVGLLRAILNNKVPQGLCGKLFKSELVKSHNYKIIDRMTNAEDGYMLYQMLPYIKRVTNISDVVYLYIQSPDSSSQRRYSDNALENIVLMNALRVSLIYIYPDLKKDIKRLVSDILNSLVIEGYDKDGNLSVLMKKHGILDYCSDRVVMETHSLWESLKIISRKYTSYLRQ